MTTPHVAFVAGATGYVGRYVVAALREAGVLTGTCGGNPNQIRLLPPLTLTTDEALSFVPMLQAALE